MANAIYKLSKNTKMKKELLSILSVLFTAILVNAQDITSYRGAFAPAPEPMWTDGWINWDPQNAVYPAATVTITAVNSDTTWTTGSVIKISGLVYVAAGKTLTIQPGVIVRGDDAAANSSLVVVRNAKINAQGTPCNPIVFTSNKAVGARAKADWGGVILLGNAKNNQGTNVQIEGTAAGDTRNFHGGTNDDDNSGTMKYVRIEYGGFVFAPNNEINGLTFGSVGRGTTIEYIQSSFINDDAFEWFGGTVNCKHLVAYRCLDDDFDTDNGFSGTVQYGLSVKDPAISDDPAVSTSEGFESDNDASGDVLTPKTAGKFYNITHIGAFRCNSNGGSESQPSAVGFRRGARLRRNSELKIFNSILMNDWRGIVVDAPTIATAQAAFQNNIIAGDYSTSWTGVYAGLSLFAEDAPTLAYIGSTNTQIGLGATAPGAIVSNACSLLTGAWDFLNPDYRPNTAFSGSPVTTGATTGVDLSPVVEIDNSSFTANQARDFLVDVLEVGCGGNSNGTITVVIPKPSGWTITVPGIVLTGTNQSGVNGNSNVNGGTPNSNGSWNFREDANNVFATSKPGVSVLSCDITQLGFTATRKAGTAKGTNQNLGANISGGGDASSANNSAITAFSAN
jgi:hypothetical protein